MIKRFLAALVPMMICVIVFAQNITVKGLVTDAETGEPVPSAAVMVKGSRCSSLARKCFARGRTLWNPLRKLSPRNVSS